MGNLIQYLGLYLLFRQRIIKFRNFLSKVFPLKVEEVLLLNFTFTSNMYDSSTFCVTVRRTPYRIIRLQIKFLKFLREDNH